MRASTQIRQKYQRAFQYCQREIHKLPYCPDGPSSPCSTAAEKLNNFIVNNEQIEKEVCDTLHIDSFNIEHFENKIEKVYSHDPYVEVNCYFTQLIEFIL